MQNAIIINGKKQQAYILYCTT